MDPYDPEKGDYIFVFFIVLSTILWYLWLFKKHRQSAPLPPGPRGLPFLGNLLSLKPNLHSCLAELAKPYGPIMKIKLGSHLCIVTSSASIAEEIFKEKDVIFANRHPTAVAYAGSWNGTDIVWSPHGDHWRMLRKICVASLLNSSRLDALYDIRRREVRSMVKQIYSEAGKPVDIFHYIFHTMFNMMANVMWGGILEGEELKNFVKEFQKDMDEIVPLILSPNMSDLFSVFAKLDIQGLGRKMKNIRIRLERHMNRIIDRRLQMSDPESTKDFLQVLLELQESGVHETLSRSHIISLILNLLGAGTKSSAITVEWAMTELLRQPHYMEKAQEEIQQVVGMDQIVEEAHCPKLHILNAIVKETLRLHPGAPLGFPRYPSESCVIGGYIIPKGTKVLVNTWAIQRDPVYWNNPLEFQPERFLGSELDYNGKNLNYVPFGAGRRVCVGIPMAERMIPYMLASLLHSFSWKLPKGDDIDLSETFGLELKKTIPLVSIPSLRFSDHNLYT